MKIETKLAQVGTGKEPQTGAINFPVYFATAYEHVDGQSTGYDYTRTSNPTRTILERCIAELEGGDQGFACSSGMAAIHTLMGLFSQGDHLLVSFDLYGGTYRLFEEVFRRYGVEFTYVDFRNRQEVQEKIQAHTKAFFLETPTNPLMQVADLRQVCRWAKEWGLLTIVDNTFMTPYCQQPLSYGADLVVHSATKYLGGHNDVLVGLIVTANKRLSQRVEQLHNSIGATLSPHDCFLLMRGMKTLALRMERHEQNARMLVQFLRKHPAIEEVFYADDHPVHRSQATGSGGMLSFRLHQAEEVLPFLQNLQLIAFAESLGGVESFITYPAQQTHADIPESIRLQIGVCDRLLRLSVGIEHVEDLQRDLDQALKASKGGNHL